MNSQIPENFGFMQYKKLMPKFFRIKDKFGNEKDFTPNAVQLRYLNELHKDYPQGQGVRENDLKARQEGFSAIIDGMFTMDFLALQRPTVSLVVSHKATETLILFNRISYYIDSFCDKNGVNRKDLLSTDSQELLVNKTNKSEFYIGTAGAKTLGRGGTVQNIHWSEVGFYPNTEILNAEKLVTSAEQQVLMGYGKIFRESTGNAVGDFFHGECERSRKGESTFKFRFYPWYFNDEYSTRTPPEWNPSFELLDMMNRFDLSLEQIYWYHLKSLEYDDKTLFIREYPSTPEEAFLASGSAFFDADSLRYYYDNKKEPIKSGLLAMDGMFV